MGDIRLNWIKQRLYDLLNVSDDAVFSEFLERDMGKFKDEVLRYLSQTRDGYEIALLFYKVSREEEERVEVEIDPELEESEQSPKQDELMASLLTVEGSDISGVSSAASDLKGKKAKGRKVKGHKKKAEEEAKRAAEEAAAKAAAEAELQQKLAESSDTAVPRTKIIIQKVWRDYLYMVSGNDITFELAAQMNCVVFLRTQEGSVPEPRDKDPTAISRQMYKHFDVVSFHGNGLTLLEDMLIDIYMPLLAYFEQRYPSTSTEELEAVAPRKSVENDSMKSHSEGKVSTSTGAAFTLLRDEFMHQLHKFKASINVVKEHLDARVNLVVPSSLHLDDSVEVDG